MYLTSVKCYISCLFIICGPNKHQQRCVLRSMKIGIELLLTLWHFIIVFKLLTILSFLFRTHHLENIHFLNLLNINRKYIQKIFYKINCLYTSTKIQLLEVLLLTCFTQWFQEEKSLSSPPPHRWQHISNILFLSMMT